MLERADYPTMTEELRDQDRLARHLPDEAPAAVEAYDPNGEAVRLLGPFVVNEPVLGRPVCGGRLAAWLALEDKLLAEDVWRAVDAPHVGADVVPVDAAALDLASAAAPGGGSRGRRHRDGRAECGRDVLPADRRPAGHRERVAPLNAALLRFLDAELGTGFGPVEVAPDVRR